MGHRLRLGVRFQVWDICLVSRDVSACLECDLKGVDESGERYDRGWYRCVFGTETLLSGTGGT